MAQSIMLTGNIGKVNGVRDVNGSQVVKFTVADTESYRDRTTGQRVEKTTWFNVDLWGAPGSFDNMLSRNIIATGNKVSLVGRMESSPGRQNPDGSSGLPFWTLRVPGLQGFNLEQVAQRYQNQNGQQGGTQQGGSQQGNGQPQGNPQGNYANSPQQNAGQPQANPQGNIPNNPPQNNGYGNNAGQNSGMPPGGQATQAPGNFDVFEEDIPF